MNQNIWGPNLWFSLHTMSFTYPLKPSQQDMQHYKSFFEALQYTIPCSVCRKNYKRHLQESPIDKHLESRKSLVFWLIDIHNMVNGETGKKILSYDAVIRKYEKVYGRKLVLEGDKDMDEDDTSLSHHLMYENQNPLTCISQYYSLSMTKVLLIIFLILLVLCYYKKYYR
jgi:hypothetical protein